MGRCVATLYDTQSISKDQAVGNLFPLMAFFQLPAQRSNYHKHSHYAPCLPKRGKSVWRGGGFSFLAGFTPESAHLTSIQCTGESTTHFAYALKPSQKYTADK